MQRTKKLKIPISNFPARPAGGQFSIKSKFSKYKLENWKINWQLENGDWKLASGMSLLEILITVTIFAFLGMIVTASIALSLKGGKKSENQVKVGENLNYAMSIIERQIRNADSISECPNTDLSILNYLDQNGEATSFSCEGIGGSDPFVASGSGKLRLTSSDVIVTSCSFTCIASTTANPPSINVFLEMQSTTGTGAQSAAVSSSTQIFLRNY